MSSIRRLTLFSKYCQHASWRVRSVLALKRVPFEYKNVDFLDSQQYPEDFSQMNPLHQVPALRVLDNDGKSHTLTQSLPIIEYLEEMYPNNSVFPRDAILRARSKAIAHTITNEPQNLKFNSREELLASMAMLTQPENPVERKKVSEFFLSKKLEEIEKLLSVTAGRYCVGDQVTIADIYFLPYIYFAINTPNFDVDLSKYPLINGISYRLGDVEMFRVTQPAACPDAPDEFKNLFIQNTC